MKSKKKENIVSMNIQHIPMDLVSGGSCPPPSKKLIDSIERKGVLEPIRVKPICRGGKIVRYEVIGGLRRSRAVVILRERRQAKLDAWDAEHPEPTMKEIETERFRLVEECARFDTIPAIVSESADEAEIIELNNLRAKNPLREFEVIERMLKRMMKSREGDVENDAIKEIARQTSLSPATVKKRLTLRNLAEPLRVGMKETDSAGRPLISVATAEAAAKLSADNQERLIIIFREKGKLTARDVHDVRSRQVKAISRGLFAALNVAESERERMRQAQGLGDADSDKGENGSVAVH